MGFFTSPEAGKDLAKGLFTVPAAQLGVAALAGTKLTSVMDYTAGMVNGVLSPMNNMTSGVLGMSAPVSAIGAPLTAGFLSNDILKKFEFFNTHNKTRYAANALVGLGAISAGTAAAPYILGAGLGYALGKPVYKFAAGTVKRARRTPWLAIKGAGSGAMNGLKGQ